MARAGPLPRSNRTAGGMGARAWLSRTRREDEKQVLSDARDAGSSQFRRHQIPASSTRQSRIQGISEQENCCGRVESASDHAIGARGCITLCLCVFVVINTKTQN